MFAGTDLRRYYEASNYLYPVPQLIEPFAIVALFYFYVSVVTPLSTVREEFYSDMERHSGKNNSSKTKSIGSLRWFYVSHYNCGRLRFQRTDDL